MKECIRKKRNLINHAEGLPIIGWSVLPENMTDKPQDLLNRSSDLRRVFPENDKGLSKYNYYIFRFWNRDSTQLPGQVLTHLLLYGPQLLFPGSGLLEIDHFLRSRHNFFTRPRIMRISWGPNPNPQNAKVPKLDGVSRLQSILHTFKEEIHQNARFCRRNLGNCRARRFVRSDFLIPTPG